MIDNKPQLFKGIALFTPGGDLVYCIDPEKHGRWHFHLCVTLQSIFNLSEPPHFLVPCYTATIDHWLDPRSQQVRTFAEAYPAVMRHQGILNAIFGSNDLVWQSAPPSEGLCDYLVLNSYRDSFPQLWEDRDLIVRVSLSQTEEKKQQAALEEVENKTQGYVLRLFVAGQTPTTEKILESLRDLLEKNLSQPYTLKVIDVLANPEQAEADQVSATPTLVKVWPQPVRRIVGLESVEKILQMLGSRE